MAELWTNNAGSALAADITNSATSLSVSPGDGALFPNPSGGDYFYCTLDDGTNLEIIKVTAVSTDTFSTIVRAQEGTTAHAFAYATPTKVELRLTATGLSRLVRGFDVMSYGAVGDGSTDDTTAIQNAINAAASAGGRVEFKPGNYKITSTLTVGNGTSTSVSTQNNVTLVGIGGSGLGSSAATLTWAGSSGGTMVTFNGPITGCGVQNIRFDCASLANTGLNLVHVQRSYFANVEVAGNKAFGIILTAYASGSGATDGANGNTFTNVSVTSTQTGSGGIIIGDATAGSGLDVAQNVFINLRTRFDGAASGTVGVKLQFCDYLTFSGLLTAAHTGLSIAPPSGSTAFPSSITLLHPAITALSGGASIAVSGTWAPSSYPLMLGFHTDDGETIPSGWNGTVAYDSGSLLMPSTSATIKAGDPTLPVVIGHSSVGYGTVSIGTGGLSYHPLTMKSTVDGVMFQMTGDGLIYGTSPILENYYGGAGAPAGMTMRFGRGSAASPSAVSLGDQVGAYTYSAYGTSAFKAVGAFRINVASSGTISDTSMPGVMLFQTTPNGSVTPTTALRLDQNQDATFSQHIVDGSGTPTLTAGTGAGTSPTVSITGGDLAGNITVTTGSGSPATNATIVTVTFHQAYASAPRSVVLTPAEVNTASFAVGKAPFVDLATIGTTTFAIKSNATALTTATTYKWFYQVIQ
jgi:Pectate lyase superfamily protein